MWSPDGTRIAVTSSLFLSQDVAVVAATGGTPKTVMDQRNLSFSATGRPAWSPDGSRIAAALTSYEEGDQGSSMVATVGVDGTSYQQAAVNSDGNNGVSPDFEQVAWSPDGNRLLFDGNTNGSDVNGTGKQVVQSIDAAGHGGGVTIFGGSADIGGYAPDGSAAVAAVNGAIEIVPLSGAVASGPVDVVHTPPAGHVDSRPIFAANGTKIVFCETDTAANSSDLYAVHKDGSALLRLTNTGQACDPAVASHTPRFAGAHPRRHGDFCITRDVSECARGGHRPRRPLPRCARSGATCWQGRWTVAALAAVRPVVGLEDRGQPTWREDRLRHR